MSVNVIEHLINCGRYIENTGDEALKKAFCRWVDSGKKTYILKDNENNLYPSEMAPHYSEKLWVFPLSDDECTHLSKYKFDFPYWNESNLPWEEPLDHEKARYLKAYFRAAGCVEVESREEYEDSKTEYEGTQSIDAWRYTNTTATYTFHRPEVEAGLDYEKSPPIGYGIEIDRKSPTSQELENDQMKRLLNDYRLTVKIGGQTFKVVNLVLEEAEG